MRRSCARQPARAASSHLQFHCQISTAPKYPHSPPLTKVNLDPRTLSTLIGLGNILFATLVILYIRQLKARNTALELWCASKIALGCGYIVNVAASVMHLSMPVYVGNLIQLGGLSLEVAAFLAYTGKLRQHIRSWFALNTLAAAIVLSSATIPYLLTYRIAVFSGVGSLYLFTIGTLLYKHQKHLPLAQIIALGNVVGGSVLLFRAYWGLHIGELIRFDPISINIALYMTAFVLLIINGFGFMLLAKLDDNERIQALLNQSIEQTNEQRRFIAMLSHEVRSPLAVIDNTAQLLSIKATDPNLQELTGRIRRGAARLTQFFETCLTADRIASAVYTPHYTSIDLQRLYRWTSEAAQTLAIDHRRSITFDPNLRTLFGDENLLRILISNLIVNAAKYAPPGTDIDIHFRRDHGYALVLAICDRGPGFADEDLGTIFDRYKRGKTAEGKPGAGLGLALARDIAILHGGTIQAANREGGGACLIVKIPLTDSAKRKQMQ